MAAMASTTNNGQQVFLYKNLDVSKLIVSKAESKNFKTAGGKMVTATDKQANVRYGDDKTFLTIQTPMMQINNGGMINPEKIKDEIREKWYNTAEKLGKIRIFENLDDEKSGLFFQKMREFDEYLGSDEMKQQIVGGKTWTSFSYCPIVRHKEPKEEDDTKETQTQQNIYDDSDYIQLNVDLDYETKAVVKTKVFNMVEGKDDEVIDVTSLEELRKYITYKSFVCYQFIATKAYVLQQAKKYGVTFKLRLVRCKSNNQTYQKQQQSFIKDDDDDNTPLSNINMSSVLDVNTNDLLDDANTNDLLDEKDEEQAPVQVSMAAPVQTATATATTTTTAPTPAPKRTRRNA